jgi:hypothetical protein
MIPRLPVRGHQLNPCADSIAITSVSAQPHTQPVIFGFRDVRHRRRFTQPRYHHIGVVVIQIAECRPAVKSLLADARVLESPIASRFRNTAGACRDSKLETCSTFVSAWPLAVNKSLQTVGIEVVDTGAPAR